MRAADVPSLLEADTTFDVSVHWVCEGWLDDIDRALAGFRATAEGRRVQFVVADVTGEAPKHWADADDVEVVWLEPDTGWAAARNAGLRRSLAPIVVALDGSVEPTGDVLGPLEARLGGPRPRHLRTVRHRHAGSPRVPGGARPRAVRRRRGLPDGVPA